MVSFVSFITLSLALAYSAAAFPAYASLAGLPREEIEKILPTLQVREPARPPPPLAFNGTKLVNDVQHPWEPLRPGDIRGPCPGLNALASHGYLPRDGIASPSQIIAAVQEGFNMDSFTAQFVTYAAHLVDGNLVTDRLSIGGKSPSTGPDPPAPATVAGLNTHAVFEGDASMTRGDAFFGDNHSFNESLFDEFVAFSNKYGGGKYNMTVAAEYRFHRIQESIATNPNFSFVSPRFFTAYAESVFPINFFIDGRQNDGQLDLDVARGFFQNMSMPKDFHRASKPVGADGLDLVAAAHPIAPGANVGGVNNYIPDPTSANFSTFCLLYENFVNKTIFSLYPNPTGALRKALNTNLDFFFAPINGTCTQVFPYGK
ncbi:heme-thiolate peroxidase [Leucocoprinus birnbaumii]|uniref:Heme-thiolate peroxidase n=1 Tax=Leucocoprinus birnbaumii TaxID=56174 RepID=A0AAD5VWE8_9AGAR|nr:heme-thiolate peroxidase [Leucocoprinus birnbaumii]